MFNNPGKKLQTVAVIMFVLIVITSLALGIVLSFNCGGISCTSASNDISRGSNSNPFVFFGILLGGIVFGYVFSLTIYGLGALIESSEKTSERLKRLASIESAIENLNLDITLTEQDDE